MLADLGADARRVLAEMVASVVAAIGAGGDSGWQVSRQRGALWSTGMWAESHAWCGACGRDWKHAAAMGDGLKTWAAQVRQQATGRHASRQAGCVRQGPTGPCGLVRLS